MIILFILNVYVDLSGYCISHGLDARNQLKTSIESKLNADNNGEWIGSGWFEGTGDIGFHNISAPDKAEERVIEAIDELGLGEIFLRMEVFPVEDADDTTPELSK